MATNEISQQDAIWLIEHANDVLKTYPRQHDAFTLAAHFRKSFTPRQTALLCELDELRRRAQAKFSLAHAMFFHRRSYEQASDEWIAGYKARRFSGAEYVVDLCAGIGGDAIALARASSELTIVDRSEPMVCFAKENLRVHGETNIQTQATDIRKMDLTAFSHWHLDPDRRSRKSRRSEPEKYEPPLSEFLSAVKRTPHGAIKVAPAANLSDYRDQGIELEWIGHGRECQQQVAWCGALAHQPGLRSATWLNRDGASWSVVEEKNAKAEFTTEMQRYVFEPRSSVLAAGLSASLAVQLQLKCLADVAYLTADRPVDSPLVACFEVLDDFALRRKALAKYLAAYELAVEDVKKRGVALDPAQIRRDVGANRDGRESVVLILYSRARQVRVAVTRPVRR